MKAGATPVANAVVNFRYDIGDVAMHFAERPSSTPAADFHGTLTWYQNFAATCLDAGDRPVFFDLSDGADGQTVLMMRLRHDRVGLLQGRTLASLTNYYSCWFSPLGLEKMRDPVAAIEDWGHALRTWRHRPHRIRFDALDSPSPAFDALATGLRRAGYWIERYPQFGNWFLAVADRDFRRYWLSRAPALRHTIERKERALRSRHAVAVDVIGEADGAESAIAQYEQVYAASWKEGEPYPQFVPGLIRVGLGAQSLEVGILSIDGMPAAAQIWIFFNGRATIFKLAHAESVKHWSPGSILTRHLMERALSNPRVAEIDFGRGDDSYKRLWLPGRRERWGVQAYDPATMIGLGHAVRNLGPQAVRRWLGTSRSPLIS
jgi:Acetyltransferase (GNAT) domain